MGFCVRGDCFPKQWGRSLAGLYRGTISGFAGRYLALGARRYSRLSGYDIRACGADLGELTDDKGDDAKEIGQVARLERYG